MDSDLKELFEQVEKYLNPLLASNSASAFSNEENRILALQHIHRLNQRIGTIARSNKAEMYEMKVLQTLVNGLTIGLKNSNAPQIRYALIQTRNMIASLP